MRRKTNGLAVLALAAVMTLSSAFVGFAETGWVANDGVWNYYSSSGAMAKNQWVKNGDSLFWIEEDGAMAVKKWHKAGEVWYWFDGSGAAATGWQEIDSKWYYFDENHVMVTDTTIDSYYVGKDGAWTKAK